MSHVTFPCFWHWIVVDLDDFVQVANNDLGDFVELCKVVFVSSNVNEGWQGERCQIADCYLVWRGIFNNFSAQVGATNSA